MSGAQNPQTENLYCFFLLVSSGALLAQQVARDCPLRSNGRESPPLRAHFCMGKAQIEAMGPGESTCKHGGAFVGGVCEHVLTAIRLLFTSNISDGIYELMKSGLTISLVLWRWSASPPAARQTSLEAKVISILSAGRPVFCF